MKTAEPSLNIRIATPCHANWEDMEGDERARFCGQCQKHVYNLSALSASAAATLVREKEGKLCARFYQRADGTVLHGGDCPVGLAARQWQQAKGFVGAAASLLLILFGLSKTQAGDQTDKEKKPPVRPPDNQPAIMGAICVPTPTPKPTATPKPK